MIEGLLRGPVTAVARRLLGHRLVSVIDGRRTAVILTEVEAYGGGDDPASHAARGRTARNASMFEAPGTLYVYRSYGIHWCMNVVCRPPGTASAVLLRGGQPIEGVDEMIRRRGRTDHLCDGPGKLAQALGVTGSLDGSSLADGPLRLEGPAVSGAIVTTPRIGISKATERPWRFVLS